jgi:Holliday junction resolvasome RuvABC ATP-dependent DNA helicase subunit
MVPQKEMVFFGPKHAQKLAPPTREQKLWAVSRDNPQSPFSKFVGNDKAIRKLQAAAYSALGKENHVQRELAFAIFGPASAGKTTIARIYAETVKLPLVEISPKGIKKVQDILNAVENALEDTQTPLCYIGDKCYLPPMIIFIDEVHALSDSVVDGLLKATEYKDCVMVTDKGYTVNCHAVTWMIATTDEGRLFDAFRTRFSPIVLQYLSKKDVAKIVKLNNPDLPDEVCSLVSHYNSRIPRKALEFSRYMRMVSDMHPEKSWDDIAKQVACDEGIDEYGMNEVHLRVLKALGQGPVARNRMSVIVGRKDEEVENNIVPWLLTETEDQPAMIGVSSRGYVITQAGIQELIKRNISYNVEVMEAA